MADRPGWHTVFVLLVVAMNLFANLAADPDVRPRGCRARDVGFRTNICRPRLAHGAWPHRFAPLTGTSCYDRFHLSLVEGLEIAVLVPASTKQLRSTKSCAIFARPADGDRLRLRQQLDRRHERGRARRRRRGPPRARRGKGNVVRRMFQDIEADIYVMVDGDDTYDAAVAPELVDAARRREPRHGRRQARRDPPGRVPRGPPPRQPRAHRPRRAGCSARRSTTCSPATACSRAGS